MGTELAAALEGVLLHLSLLSASAAEEASELES